MYTIRSKYDDLAARKQQLLRNKWKVDFGVSSNATFYTRMDSPTAEDLKYWSIVFGCTMDELVESSEVATKARPLADIVKGEKGDSLATELGLSK